MNVRIENPTSTPKQYEYWTCTTLGPGGGGDPYGTALSAASPETDVVSPNPLIEQYSGYTWMRQVEDQASPAETAGLPALPASEQYLRVNHLKRMINWSNNGIAYGQGLATNPQGNWWGVVDRTSGEGVLRIGDNAKTPGMKYWEWGFNGSFATNPYSKGNSGRPYVELWSGVSREFFVPDVLQPGEVKQFDQAFMPTMDMKDTTNANADGAGLIEFPGDRRVTARVFSTHVGRLQTAKLVDSASGRTIASQTFVADPLKSVQLSGFAPHGTTAKLVLSDAGGTALLTAERSDGLPRESADFEEATVGGSVAPTLSLTLAGPASLGAFTPGADKEYKADTTANVVSTAGDAALSVSDPGHLTNGAFTLPEPLRVDVAPAAWTEPVSNATVGIGFRQRIGANDALRTGSYSKTLTFTLSTTSP
jgi:hypothetical protein